VGEADVVLADGEADTVGVARAATGGLALAVSARGEAAGLEQADASAAAQMAAASGLRRSALWTVVIVSPPPGSARRLAAPGQREPYRQKPGLGRRTSRSGPTSAYIGVARANRPQRG